MIRWLRTDLRTIIVAIVASAVTAAAPVIAETVANADTVDHKHAVGFGASSEERAGKLVATNGNGHLPNDIIVKARDADRIDGVDSRQLRSVSIDVHGAALIAPATVNGLGISLPADSDSGFTIGLVYPPDRQAGRPVRANLVIREHSSGSCAIKLAVSGFITPINGGLTANGLWSITNGGQVAGHFAVPAGASETRTVRLSWIWPDDARRGVSQGLTLQRLGSEASDTCTDVEVVGASVSY